MYDLSIRFNCMTCIKFDGQSCTCIGYGDENEEQRKKASLRGEEAEAVAENGGAGEKVKEAISKSIGKSKATLEDIAKSAANLAKDNLVNNKRSLSNDREEIKDQPKKEL
ncbi:hypothetical protein RIF29_28413 [Crotalaria pallida]|uniref:Uncharacterized protein n=1 Tax=Crotalaria pallida TaxID=3830 RepID=A0AAN9ECS2_CROPI